MPRMPLESKPITKKQKAALLYIKKYIDEKGTSPRMEDIRIDMNLNSVSTVHEMLKRLELKGFIRREKYKVRGISVSRLP